LRNLQEEITQLNFLEKHLFFIDVFGIGEKKMESFLDIKYQSFADHFKI